MLDLEPNQGFSRTLITAKTVERSYLKKGEEPISIRTNSNGDMVYLLPANAQQMETNEAAGVSKAIRTMGERLLPPHYKAEWRKLIEQTILDQTAKDPEAAKHAMLDNFAERGVLPSAIEMYLEHPLDAIQPAELSTLRKIYVAITNAEVTWRDVMIAKFGTDADTKDEPAGAKKVREVLARKAAAPAAAAPAPAPAPPAPPAQPAAATGPQRVPDPPAVSQEPEAPVQAAAPADLAHHTDWPDQLDEDFYWIGDVVYRFDAETSSYKPHSDRQFIVQAEPVKDAPKRRFNFPRAT